MRRALLAVAATAAATLAVATPALAAPDPIEDVVCGVPVAITFSGSDRTITQRDGTEIAPFPQTTTFTSLDTGNSVVLRGSGLTKVTTTTASDGTVTQQYLNSGATEKITSTGHGRPLLLEAGRLLQTIVYNDESGFSSFDQQVLAGPHPDSGSGSDAAFCSVVVSLLNG